MKKFYGIAIAIMTLLVLTSCENTSDGPITPDEDFMAATTSFEEEDLGIETQLGKKLENPYTLAVMRKAYSKLMETPTEYDHSILDISDIRPTDRYVKFFVKSDDEMERLEEDSLYLSQVPLDYEVLVEGDYFGLDKVDQEQGIWVYTCVPFDYQAPVGIQYEVIEELFLTEPSYISGEETKSEVRSIHGKEISAEFLDDLEDIALQITGNYTEPEDEEEDALARRKKRRPQGYVKVYNTTDRKYEGVPQVRVRTRRWFKFGKAWTSGSGYYSVNRRYRRNCRYTVIFKNRYNWFRIRPAMISFWIARHKAGKKSPKGYDFNFKTSSRSWRFATVNNAALQYRNYCSRYGVGLPHSKLKITAGNGTGASAAPMLSKVGNVPVLTTFLRRFGIIIPPSKVWIVLRFATPDIIIRANSSKKTAGITEETFHEMSHASHFRKVGSNYWLKVIDYIAFHGAYGNGKGKYAGYVEVAEMWGYFIANKFMDIRRSRRRSFYGSPSSGRWIHPDRMRRTIDDANYSIRELFSALKTHVNSSCDVQKELAKQYGRNVSMLKIIYGCGGS